ncbi:hypothetical protein [Anaeromicrobium sediminis]|uniref:Uncharacterized protein n=1 Tax=Anaeromicrobium sediminis TaxID=1478221 RepID=A0A267MQZ1_9FIRM|nr:hypothetical protein [Anaeromicrobium sediminis]PAB61345.1 hypothetical protein CCE28_02645 [Anaeromicrobium sediminis]
MKDIMKELTATILGLSTVSEDINKHMNQVLNLVETFNTTLDPKNKKHMFVAKDQETFIAPVAIAGLKNKEELDLVYFGLNPKFGDDTSKEKRQAINHKSGYYNFYHSKAIFDYLMNGKSNTYYKRVIRVLFSIFGHPEMNTIKISNIRKRYGFDENKDHEIFFDLLKSKSIAFPELIPFHSWKFNLSDSDVAILRKSIPSYDRYVNKLMKYIAENLSADGVVISNGQKASNVIKNHLISMKLEERAFLVYDDKAMEVYKWKNSHWALLKGQIAPGASPIFNANNMYLFGQKIKEIV